MLQRVLPIALVACLVAPLSAQAPAGMKMRVDKSTDASDPDNTPDVKVVTVGKGFRVTGGPAVVLWNAANTATGNYSLKGTFTLMKPSSHQNFYGLVFGGSALEGAAQAYTYFTVAQTGAFLIKGRNGEQTPTIARGQNAAIKTPDANGTSGTPWNCVWLATRSPISSTTRRCTRCRRAASRPMVLSVCASITSSTSRWTASRSASKRPKRTTTRRADFSAQRVVVRMASAVTGEMRYGVSSQLN